MFVSINTKGLIKIEMVSFILVYKACLNISNDQGSLSKMFRHEQKHAVNDIDRKIKTLY